MWCKALFVFVFSFFLHQGEATKCYSCTSATDSKCADPFNDGVPQVECTPNLFKEGATFLKDAAESVSGFLGKVGIESNLGVPEATAEFSCVKVVKQENDKKLYIRSCTIPKNDKFDICTQMKAQTGGAVTFCEDCQGDGCNSASGVTPGHLLMLLAAALLAMLLRQ